jgi:L-fuculose-phosphate aldolase
LYLSDFQQVGRELYQAGLISQSSGNLSLRLNGYLIITRHGSLLSALEPTDLIKTGIDRDDAFTSLASWELPVHRAIYRKTDTSAIVHAHPVCAVAISLQDRIIGGRIPVIGDNIEVIAGVMGDDIANALNSYHLVMVKGHGSFARGKTLDEACRITLEFEKECRKLCKAREISPKSVSE